MPLITITGAVCHQNGNLIDNIRVAAVERKFPNNRTVGQPQIPDDGAYLLTIDLSVQSFYLVEVRDETGKVVASKGPFSAFSGDRRVNFEISDSRFQGKDIFSTTSVVLNDSIQSWLQTGNNSPNALEDAQLIAIGAKLSLSESWRFLKAHELEEATKSSGSADNVIPAQTWYGLLKQGMPASITALSALPIGEVEEAIQRAKAANQINPGESAENLMRQWKTGLTTKALEEKPEGLEASLVDIFNLSGITPPQKRKLIELMSNHDVNSGDFWSKVGDMVKNQGRLARLRKSVQLAAFSGFQPAMIGALLDVNTSPDIHAVAALADRDAQAWEVFLQQPANTGRLVPSFIKGDNENERRKKYATGLARAAERAFPEHAFFGRLRESGGFGQQTDALRRFFAQNPDFTFKQASVKNLTEGEGMDLTGISNPTNLLKELRSARRMMNFTDSTAVMQQLRLEGLDSAAAVSGVPRGEFVGKYADYFQSQEEAIDAHRQAAHIAGFTQLLWVNHHPSQQIETAATPGEATASRSFNNSNEPTTANSTSDDSSNWRNLFGSLDACACEHCLSLYSPAAYLTDLLHFLETRSTDVFNELVRRRPDLQLLILNCENSNTPIPYVDLVIELLENLVMPAASPAIYQTTLLASELAANPEHINQSAYNQIKTAVYPWSLPFDMALEESRIYLSHLGVSRYELMRHFCPGSTQTAFEDAGVACEFLGMSKQEWDIITAQINGNGGPDSGTWNFYGFDRPVGFRPISNPMGGTLASTNDWLETLAGRVDVFLQQTGLSYIELLSLLDCFFINPGRSKISIVSTNADKPATCQLEELRLNGLEEADLVRLHRFVRLARRLQWSFADLDKALFSKGIRGVNADGMPKNSRIYLTASDLIYLSQVEQMRRSFGCSVEEVLGLWVDIPSTPYTMYSGEKISISPSLYERLFCDKTVINPPNPAFKTNPATLSGRIRAQASTISAALETDEATVLLLTNQTTNLTLSNLSSIYRQVMLARWLNMEVFDLQTTISLTGIDPFGHPTSILSFLQSMAAIEESGFSLQELDYLLRHRFLETESIQPTDGEIAVFFADIIRVVEKDGAPFIEFVEKDEEAVIKKVISTFKLSAKAATQLLKKYMTGIASTGTSLLQDLMSSSAGTRKNAYVKLAKVAMLLQRFKITDDELDFLVDQQAVLGSIPFDELPVVEQTTANFSGFITLSKFIQTRDKLNIGADKFVEILRLTLSPGLDKGAWISKVTKLKICDEAILQALVGPAEVLSNGGLLKTNFPANFHNGGVLLNIWEVYNLMKSTGLNPTIVAHLTKPELTSEAAQSVKSAAKSRHDTANWHKIAQPLRDVLRERQRVALVDYLVHNSSSWRSAEDLYEYMLIDVEMKPVAMTSRLKQATCSVQLFIDRVLMNLERDSDGDPILLESQQAEEWKTWRKIYRVWEANRKVFFYPENWIEPELRDNQTPIFKDAVSALLQSELSPETVEDVFRSYLEKLDDIARLEIVGIVRQQEGATTAEEAIDITHVFGRTQAQPHKYFHRTFENGEWTPWLPIEGDIDGDHLVPVVFNRRLCLFWLFFTQESEERNYIDPTQRIEKAKSCWKIQVAWSEHRKNVWSAKKLSKRFIKTAMAADNNNLAKYRDELFLRHYIEDGSLFIHVSQSSDAKRLLLDSGKAECQASFVFEDSSNEPQVMGDTLPPEFSLLLPEGTKLDKQMLRKFTAGGLLRLGYENITPQGNIVLSATHAILNPNPNNGLRLVVQTGVAQPLQHSFVFQDNKHVFWVDVTKGGIVENPWVTARTAQGANRLSQPVTPDISHIEFALNDAWGNDLYPPASITRTRQANPYDWTRPDNDMIVDGNGEIFEVTPGDTAVNPCLPRRASLPNNAAGSNMRVKTYITQIPAKSPVVETSFYYRFTTFHHPQVKNFMRELNRYGVSGVLRRELQNGIDMVQFSQNYKPTQLVLGAYPTGKVDFAYGSPYSQYNWELFFHLPIHIACRLNADQRFEEARKWFHYIFNPTTSESGSKERFWQFQPFRDEAVNVKTLEELLKDETQLAEQVEKWAANPFQPHVVARMRITAYMKFTLMKYLDNLMAWADQLFRRDTIESINEATNLYVIAAKILGAPPQRIPARAKAERQTYDTIKDKLGGLNPQREIESILPPSSSIPGSADTSAFLGTMGYFCLPPNQQLVRYWDTVADRLFKIRHSLSIEGISRTLPLFEPPIDPALLVRAAAAGLDINSLLDDNSTVSQPHYRFMYMLQKANELANEVKGLGSALLSALERRDAETLSLLRSGHERHLLVAVLQVRERQVEEAKEQVTVIKKNLDSAKTRYDYYSSQKMNSREKNQLALIVSANILRGINIYHHLLSAGLKPIGAFKLGSPTTTGVETGPEYFAKALDSVIRANDTGISLMESIGSGMLTHNSYIRRQEEWDLQKDLAQKEIEQIEKQIIAAEIRLAIAQRERSNHRLQMEQSAEADEFMRTKFTNRQLFDWMAGQVSSLYFQTYQMAYDYAKQAEKCFQLELPHETPGSGYVKFGYWDNLKQGLMAGEKLQLDLRRLEQAYMVQNTRELELSKHISLQQLNPLALLQLRENGSCSFAIPEELFDLDFPGHYNRRIKSVSITIPCIAGPYTTINATLRLKNEGKRKKENLDYDAPLTLNEVTEGAIATSSAQNDSGLFELNFRDERYLPFEGAGAISEWALEMMEDKSLRQFDYHTIADVIVHLRYMARGDGNLKTAAITHLKGLTATLGQVPLTRLFSLRHDFPNEWHTWTIKGLPLAIKLEKRHFPYFAQMGSMKIQAIHAYQKTAAGVNIEQAVKLENINKTLGTAGWEWKPGTALAKDREDWFLMIQYNI